MKIKNPEKLKRWKGERRHRRVRAKIKGTSICPRLFVSRSIKHLFVQLIDDTKDRTLASASDVELGFIKRVGKRKRIVAKAPKTTKERSTKEAVAYEIGKLIAKKAKGLGIGKVVFDRGKYKYHGRLKAVAKGAREGGLEF